MIPLDTKVFVAAAGFPDCDPCIRIVGKTSHDVELMLKAAIAEEQEYAAEAFPIRLSASLSSDPYSEPEDFPMWHTGVTSMTLSDLDLSDSEMAELEDWGVAYLQS